MTVAYEVAPGVYRRLCPFSQALLHSACLDRALRAGCSAALSTFEARLLNALAQAGC